MSNKMLFINSTIAFALAALVMFTLHELGHAAAAISFGLHPVVRPFSVDYGTATKTQNIVILLAGPFVSLVLGMMFLAMPRVGKGFWRLLVLWLGLNGVQTFTGYLITAPFGGVGDIGGTLHLLKRATLDRARDLRSGLDRNVLRWTFSYGPVSGFHRSGFRDSKSITLRRAFRLACWSARSFGLQHWFV